MRLGVLGAVLLICALVGWYSLMGRDAMIRMPGKSYSGPLPPLTAYEKTLGEAIRRDVEKLAGDIGERNTFRPKRLEEAADYLEQSLAEAGLEVHRYSYQVDQTACHNLEAELKGAQHPEDIYIIGAHYDSVIGSPGANDNATGAAAVLALARAFSSKPVPRTLRFCLFPNEEPPYFMTSHMGSRVYAKICRQREDNILGAIIPETIGYYRDEPGSQQYPFPVSFFYPGTGNFIGFVGNVASRDLVSTAIESFRRQVKFPSEGIAAPGVIAGIGWSDHWSFWQEGYQGIMLTDTAPFRYPHYHSPDDTPDKIDYERTARVVAGLEKVIEELIR